jgi:hypothetical protein
VCTVSGVNARGSADGRVMRGIQCTSDSDGRLSRWRLRVREEKRDGVWI